MSLAESSRVVLPLPVSPTSTSTGLALTASTRACSAARRDRWQRQSGDVEGWGKVGAGIGWVDVGFWSGVDLRLGLRLGLTFQIVFVYELWSIGIRLVSDVCYKRFLKRRIRV